MPTTLTHKTTDIEIEDLGSEREDQQSPLPDFEVLTYPADYTLQSHVKKLEDGEVEIRGFQRKYVWTQAQASKLIESFLMGLPVPPVYLYLESDTGKMIVVDGQQRLKSIYYFYKGEFGEETNGKSTVFRLTGLRDGSKFAGKTYKEIGAANDKAKLTLDNAVLRSFVIRQLEPKNDDSVYQIFERLNTGGTLLQGQEIRNCIYHGALNDLLRDELNKDASWREILGKRLLDKRFRDAELILRFLALHYGSSGYEKPMKHFLNSFMKAEQNPTPARLDSFRKLFLNTTTRVRNSLGPTPFHIQKGLNVAAFDAVFTAFARHATKKVPANIKARFKRLKSNAHFKKYINAGTTDKDVVLKRLALASSVLFGVGRK